MVDPRFYEVHMNKLNFVRIILCLISFCLVLSIFIVTYLSFYHNLAEGYTIFHGILSPLITYLLGLVITQISDDIDLIRTDFYSAIKERNLTFDEYQQQKKERK